MIKLKPFAGLVALIALTIFSSCKKENSDDTDTPVTPTPSGNSTYLSGTVVDRTGSLLEGVTVFYGSEITTTDNHGYFTFGSVSCGERVYVRTEKNGFFNGSLGAIASVSSQTNLNIVMTDNSVDYTFNAAAGQLINLPGGASIDFTPNSIATESGTAYNGNVNVASEYLDPDDLDFQNIIPGGDLIGMDQDDAMQQLVSYGMLMVTLTDNSGNELNLLSGNNATITMPVPASMASDAPSQMPLWHYDEITGIWMEEGSATLIGGEYVGTVTHFSSWNADVPSDRAQVRGIVYDCNGQPMAGIQVTVGQGSATTGSNGEFQRYVPTGVSFDVYVNSSALGLTSSSVNVPSMTAGDVFDAIQLSTECVAYVSFNITCNNGGDVNGYAAVNWGNQYTYVNITHTGNYQVPVPADGSSGTLNLIGLTSGVAESVAVNFPSAVGGSTNAGSFDLCGSGQPTGDYYISLTINGAGFNNYTFTQSNTGQMAYATYSPSDDVTLVYATEDGSDYITLSLIGNSSGVWDLETDVDAAVGFNLNGELWFAESGTLTCQQMGNVGQLVTGNFSGSFAHFTGTDFETATVTNGTFSVIRNPDMN